MKKEFVTYGLALRMKGLGFNEDCFARYEGKLTPLGEKPLIFEFTFANLPNTENKVGYPNYPYQDVEAPTYSQAFRWFESKGYRNYVASNQFGGKVNYWFAITPPEELTYSDVEGRSTKEEAELACLEKLIEIVEQKNAEMTEHGVYK